MTFRFANILVHDRQLSRPFGVLASFRAMAFIGGDDLFFQHEKGGADAVAACRKIEIRRFCNEYFIAEGFD